MAAEDFAIIGTQIEESFVQTSEEAEICLKRLQTIHLSSLDCSQGEGDHTAIPQTMSSSDNKKHTTKKMQHVATPVHPSHLSIQLGKHKAGCTNRENFISILP